MNSIQRLPLEAVQGSGSQNKKPPPGVPSSAESRQAISIELAKGYAAVAVAAGLATLLSGFGMLMAITSTDEGDFSTASLGNFARVTVRPW